MIGGRFLILIDIDDDYSGADNGGQNYWEAIK